MKFRDAPSKRIFLAALSPNQAGKFVFCRSRTVVEDYTGRVLHSHRFVWCTERVRERAVAIVPNLHLGGLVESVFHSLVSLYKHITFNQELSWHFFACNRFTLCYFFIPFTSSLAAASFLHSCPMLAVCMSFPIHSQCNFPSTLFLPFVSYFFRRAVMFCSCEWKTPALVAKLFSSLTPLSDGCPSVSICFCSTTTGEVPLTTTTTALFVRETHNGSSRLIFSHHFSRLQCC